jgi:hypothetical protein
VCERYPKGGGTMSFIFVFVCDDRKLRHRKIVYNNEAMDGRWWLTRY